jgi:hypothetical protein
MRMTKNRSSKRRVGISDEFFTASQGAGVGGPRALFNAQIFKTSCLD